jgi:hypothetical protein
MTRRGTVTFCHPRGNWYIVTDLDDPTVKAFTIYQAIDTPGYRVLSDDDEVEFECEVGPPEAALPYRTTWVRLVRHHVDEPDEDEGATPVP